jgi:Abnormal spindle-like microcephaly-assoc'd, ASPM-SPD-2-Hydin
VVIPVPNLYLRPVAPVRSLNKTNRVLNLKCRHLPAPGLAGSKVTSVYRTAALWIALAGMLGSAGCTGFTSQLGTKSGPGTPTEPPSPPTQTSIGAQISVSTSQVNFGNVAVGSSTSQVLSVTDVGTEDVKISGVSAGGSGFSVSGGSGVTLNPTQSVGIYVNFSPGSAGSATGSLSISSNSRSAVPALALSGTGITAQHTVGLTWVPSSSPVIGYYVYRGVSASSLSKLNNSVDATASYTDQGVAGGQTYIYAVTSVDSSNVESGFSNQVSVTIPNN